MLQAWRTKGAFRMHRKHRVPLHRFECIIQAYRCLLMSAAQVPESCRVYDLCLHYCAIEFGVQSLALVRSTITTSEQWSGVSKELGLGAFLALKRPGSTPGEPKRKAWRFPSPSFNRPSSHLSTFPSSTLCTQTSSSLYTSTKTKPS